MNDYKELISTLRTHAEYCEMPFSWMNDTYNDAANAIEHLCADVARLEAENRAKESYIAETIGKVIKERNYYKDCADEILDCCTKRRACIAMEKIKKERDAAIADLRLVANNCFEDYVFSACSCCKKNDTCNGQPATGCDFEWRGVREVEHEDD